jgi:hypothetical protein
MVTARVYSTVTDFARLRGWSTSRPRARATSAGEDLERDEGQQRRQQRLGVGQPDDVVGVGRHAVVAVGRQDDRAGPAGAHLLDVVHELGLQGVPRRDDDHGRALLDERDRPVLDLAGREPLGRDVGELLELERPLERHRVADVAAEEQHPLLVLELPRELADAVHAGEQLGDEVRHLLQVAQVGAHLVRVAGAAQLREVEPHDVHGGDLGHHRLGRGDGDLGARRACTARRRTRG